MIYNNIQKNILFSKCYMTTLLQTKAKYYINDYLKFSDFYLRINKNKKLLNLITF